MINFYPNLGSWSVDLSGKWGFTVVFFPGVDGSEKCLEDNFWNSPIATVGFKKGKLVR